VSSYTPKVEWLLRLGDTTLILGHRLSEWCGHAPALEEDLAIANTALDLLGHARLWLTYAGELEGKGRDEDQLAYLRDANEYRNLLMVEQANGSYADTLARQFYFDLWHHLLLERLRSSSDKRVAEIAGKAWKEVTYHLRRSTDLVIRLGDGTEESHRRMQAAVDDFWIYTGELFEADMIEESLCANGVACDPRRLRQPWLDAVTTTLMQATLVMPTAKAVQTGGRRGVHTERLGYLLAEMQFVQRAYPGARW